MATPSSGAEMSLSIDQRSNLEVIWSDETSQGNIKAEATFVSAYHIPTRYWDILQNHPDVPPAPRILGYELVTVMADKLSCISRRAAARDFLTLKISYIGRRRHPRWVGALCRAGAASRTRIWMEATSQRPSRYLP